MKKPAPSKQQSSPQAASDPGGLAPLDAVLIALLLALAMFMMVRAGFRRGLELMPWPDGLEYSAAAVNIDRGLGPVLHFGGYSYPSRYTEGYPLMLAAAYPLLGHRVERLCLATMMTGLLAIVALYMLARRMFDRVCACIACVLLALSPVFITYSTLVLSDVPTLALTIFAALAFHGACESRGSPASAAICGVFAGFTVMIRPTNATILIGIVAAMLIVGSRPSIKMTIAFGLAFAIFPLWQAWTNTHMLGSPFASGYVFWVPEVYGAMGKTFSARFLFGPTMPGNPWGNVVSYVLMLSGLDGMLGDPGDPRYLMYPFASAAFAVIGILAARRTQSRSTLRTLWFGVAFLGALLAVYLFYFFTEIAFILPAAFILFAVSGYGIVAGNRTMLKARKVAR
ncbi:MAG TPA: glycosyltransferase family 39 protein, partial [Candidatus Binataceae bacterium]|nr:glycosyltransferase family 39 protein [Candidatus Binataceae bacterium]